MNKRSASVAILILVLSPLALMFNNCSQVQMTDLKDAVPTQAVIASTEDTAIRAAPEVPAVVAEIAAEPEAAPVVIASPEPSPAPSPASSPSPVASEPPPALEPEPVATVPTIADQAGLIELPVVPITDLIDHPELAVIYQCPNSDGKVMICHFPQGSSPPNTQCIGSSAVSTHFGHTRNVEIDGVAKTVIDYLGPCR